MYPPIRPPSVPPEKVVSICGCRCRRMLTQRARNLGGTHFSVQALRRRSPCLIQAPAFRASTLRARVWAACLADALRSAAVRDAEAAPPAFPPLRTDEVSTALPRPEPPFLPPPVNLLTVAHARASASSRGTPCWR